MHIELDITGDIVERQELLNGSTILTLEGASLDGVWTMNGLLGWNIGTQRDQSDGGEGDLTLVRDDGSELFATLTGAAIADTDGTDETDADHTMRLEFEIDGGSGAFESASGTASASGVLAADTFAASWKIDILTD